MTSDPTLPHPQAPYWLGLLVLCFDWLMHFSLVSLKGSMRKSISLCFFSIGNFSFFHVSAVFLSSGELRQILRVYNHPSSDLEDFGR